jgi:hypothetical protein
LVQAAEWRTTSRTGDPTVSLSELADHSAGALASCWRASSISDSSTNIATRKRVEEMVEDVEIKVPHIKTHGEIDCAAAVTHRMLADVR